MHAYAAVNQAPHRGVCKEVGMMREILVTVAVTLLPVAAFAQDVVERVQRPEPRNIVYAEVVTVLLASAVSVNYERVLHQHFSVRGGFGAGYAIGPFSGTAGLGPQVMVNFFTRGPHKFEVGAGAAVIYRGRDD